MIALLKDEDGDSHCESIISISHDKNDECLYLQTADDMWYQIKMNKHTANRIIREMFEKGKTDLSVFESAYCDMEEESGE